MSKSISRRNALLLSVIVLATVTAAFIDPVAQDPGYHHFADTRSMFGVPNFLNVVSNLPFFLVGIAGLYFVVHDKHLTGATVAWRVLFASVSLTALGSSYYHLAPANDTLLWDRLAMTIGFMSFVAIVVGEYLSERTATRLLLPLLLLGIASVLYWAHTESLGQGDLRAYALVQFLPVVLIPMIVVLYRERSDLGPYIGAMILFYISAKLFELFDAEVFAAGHLVSGHSLKHLFGAMAPAGLLYGLTRRRYHAARID